MHFRAAFHDAVVHPTAKSHVTREAIVYSAERATGATDLALRVLPQAYCSPRPKHRAIVEWAQADAHIPTWLADIRHNSEDRN